MKEKREVGKEQGSLVWGDKKTESGHSVCVQGTQTGNTNKGDCGANCTARSTFLSPSHSLLSVGSELSTLKLPSVLIIKSTRNRGSPIKAALGHTVVLYFAFLLAAAVVAGSATAVSHSLGQLFWTSTQPKSNLLLLKGKQVSTNFAKLCVFNSSVLYGG